MLKKETTKKPAGSGVTPSERNRVCGRKGDREGKRQGLIEKPPAHGRRTAQKRKKKMVSKPTWGRSPKEKRTTRGKEESQAPCHGEEINKGCLRQKEENRGGNKAPLLEKGRGEGFMLELSRKEEKRR